MLLAGKLTSICHFPISLPLVPSIVQQSQDLSYLAAVAVRAGP
jgi:hypothetical protein